MITMSSISRFGEKIRKIEEENRKTNAGIANQSAILNDKLIEIREGIANQSTILNEKLIEIRDGIISQLTILNVKLSKIDEGLVNEQSNINKVEEICGYIREGIDNQSTLLNEKLEDLIKGSTNEQRIINDGVRRLVNLSEGQQTAMNNTLSSIATILKDISAKI